MEFGETFFWFVLIGLCAQLVDGALGMAYGLVSSSVMLGMGLPPAQVSASIHAAEVFTTGASGASHLAMGNVDKRLFLRLRSEEHTSELQSRENLVCRLLLEKKKKTTTRSQ